MPLPLVIIAAGAASGMAVGGYQFGRHRGKRDPAPPYLAYAIAGSTLAYMAYSLARS